MKINEFLNNVIKKIDGNLIAIGINNEQTIKLIEKNTKITECNLLDCINIDDEETGKIKKIKVRKLRKKFKKNKTNYIIYNIDSVKEFKEKFVYDSIYLCNKDIYLYDSNNNNLESVIRRYNRYSSVETVKCNDGMVLKISKTKEITKINELLNNIKNNFINIVDIISNLLIN